MHRTPAHRRVAVVTVMAGALLVTGCSGDEPVVTPLAQVTPSEEPAEPTPAATEETDGDEALKQANIDEAKQRVLDFFEVSAETSANAHEDWDVAFIPFLDIDLLTRFADLWGTYEQDGVYSEGEAKVGSLTATDYQPSDGGYEKVTLDACVDYGPVELFEADGTPIERPDGSATRYMVEFVVGHEPENDLWRIEQLNPRMDETC